MSAKGGCELGVVRIAEGSFLGTKIVGDGEVDEVTGRGALVRREDAGAGLGLRAWLVRCPFLKDLPPVVRLCFSQRLR